MTEERLKKANELSERIKEYKKEIEAWEFAKGFKYKSVQLSNDCNCAEVKTNFINFEVMKVLTLDRLKKDLDALETEFKNL